MPFERKVVVSWALTVIVIICEMEDRGYRYFICSDNEVKRID